MQTTRFDAIIVGSGASGGWAAKRLSEAGIKVALLEAGKPQTGADFTEHVPAYDLTYRDRASEWIRRTRPRQRDCYACREWNYKWFVNDLEEPYTTPDGKPFSWQGRTRVVGGRTNVWGRQSYRFSNQDLHAKSFDGYGEDWPLSYEDLAPYYDLVEEYIGVQGMTEGLPGLPDGRFQAPMAMTCAEVALRTRIKKAFGRTLTQGRTANLSRATNLAEFELYFGDAALLKTELDRYLAVTNDDVKRVANTYFSAANRTRLDVVPNPAPAAAASAQGATP